jgi:hypothetical protein
MFENMGSAADNRIDSMTVAEVRKALAQMRKKWGQHSVMRPFYPSSTLIHDLSTSEFAFQFVMGHHHKRHQKTKTITIEEEDDEDRLE